MKWRVKDSLRNGGSVVYDATNLSRKRRKALLDELKKFDCEKKIIVFIEPVEVCKSRNLERDFKWIVPDKLYSQMLRSFNVPMKWEGWDSIEFVQSNSGVGFGLEMLKGRIEAFGDQENSHHSLSLYSHSMLCCKLFREKFMEVKGFIEEFGIAGCATVPMYIAGSEAALFHDCGKLITKDFRDSRGNSTKDAHYYGHENVGAYLYLCACAFECQITELELLTAALINWHMRPYLTMNSSKREAEYQMLGDEFVETLEILHWADRAAH